MNFLRQNLAFARLIIAALAAVGCNVHAADVAVPDELKSWQGWVLHGEEFRRCPFFGNHLPSGSNDYVCAWPERLVLNVNARGGEFTQRWQVFADSWVALPGDRQHWPQAVRLNGAAAPVIERDGVPKLRLIAGNYTVSGSLQWSVRPEQISVPTQTGIVELTVDGRAIPQPERPDGAVWLGKRRSAEQQAQMTMQVYRFVKDDVPVMLTTQIRLQVSGEAREESLGAALPANFVPMSISSALPARIDNDGSLRVQLRPGQWVITIEARGATVATELTAPIVTEGGEEIWNYQANDRLRVAAVEGVENIDPAQANVPVEWRGYPSYRMSKGAILKIVERSRGLDNQDANQLQLHRQLWLDFEHGGYTAVDSISGTMRQDWRLDMAKPFAVMSARLLPEGSLLVTAGAAPELTGIEVRAPHLNLQTVSRVAPASGRMPATGWQTRFASVSGQLNLPPGHHLISALGDVDASTSWTASWGLLDFFIVLIAAVGAWKVRSITFGVLTLGALVLVHQEQRWFAWLLVNVLLAVALVKLAPLGRLKNLMSWYRAASLAAIVIVLFPFVVTQVRLGLYPQLEASASYDSLEEPRVLKLEMPAAAPAPAPELEIDAMPAPAAVVQTDALAADSAILRQDYKQRSFSRSSQQASVSQRYAPGTVVQTGPGVPSWNFNTYPYSWSGPVVVGETVRFIIATPFWMFVWRVAGVLLLALVIAGLAQMSFKVGRATALVQPFLKKSASALAMILFVAVLTPRHVVAAATPDAEVLGELKARLTQPPACAPMCTEALAVQITVSTDKLEMSLDVAALANVAVAIPVAVGRWEPESITVDGQSAGAIYRDAQQNYWVALKSGAHTIRMSGRLAAAESIQLVFPQVPRVIKTVGSGWEFSGISDGRLLTNALELVRIRSTSSTDKLFAATQFAPFVRVRRLLQFDLDWSVITIVERVAPDKGAFTVEIPLLKDESVLTPGITIREKNGIRMALVGLSSGQSEVTWTSALPRAQSMELAMIANEGRSIDRTESWSFAVSPVWNVRFVGVPQVAPLNAAALWTFDYFPRIGETLKLAIYRPEAVAGQTLAIDNVNLVAIVGTRASNNTLNLNYRSTQGGRHTIVLPKDAQVTAVAADGVPVSVRPQNGELPISLLPGAHRLNVQWQTDSGAQWRTQVPTVDLKAAASNINTQINLGEARWVLFAHGPGVGPAILYWGELLVFIVLAVLLGRYTQSPLRMHDWLLLGLGLSTFSWSVLLLFAIWIFAMRWRATNGIEVSALKFNLRQLVLGTLSVIAIGSLISAIPSGLLGQPDMNVHSPGGGLSWFVDQASSTLPQPSVYSLPLVVYKVAILLWALWLSFALLRWLPWAWAAFGVDGIWRGKIREA